MCKSERKRTERKIIMQTARVRDRTPEECVGLRVYALLGRVQCSPPLVNLLIVTESGFLTLSYFPEL